MACVNKCPVGIDIRKGQNIACIHCAECVDSCADVMGVRRKSSLIGYFFGLPGQGGRVLRQNAVMFGIITAAFLFFFIYLLSSRSPLDMTVLPNYSFQPQINSKGTVINSYIITLKNRGRADAELKTGIKGSGSNIKMLPDRVLYVKAGEMKRFPVYIYIDGIGGGTVSEEIEIMIESLNNSDLTATDKANFIVPEKK